MTGCGGYGTLVSFSWAMLLGLTGTAIGVPNADVLIDGAALWILLGQVNLYRRVNELCSEEACGIDGPPLHAWWALLPPPLDVVVGLRQVRRARPFPQALLFFPLCLPRRASCHRKY